jgi:hypothetical protein
MGFSGTGATHKNEVIRLIHETAGCELFNVRLFQKAFFPIKMDKIPVVWEFGGM